MGVLEDVVMAYCKEYPDLRTENESLSNFDFNNEFGFRIQVPRSWCYDTVLYRMVDDFQSCLIIYNTADQYSKIRAFLEDVANKASFLSWHEIYFAIYNKPRDIRPLQRINKALDSDLIIVVSSGQVDQEVMYHVQSFSTGCLIRLD